MNSHLHAVPGVSTFASQGHGETKRSSTFVSSRHFFIFFRVASECQQLVLVSARIRVKVSFSSLVSPHTVILRAGVVARLAANLRQPHQVCINKVILPCL